LVILLLNFSCLNLIYSQSSCIDSPQGPVIHWSPDIKLKWSDFKATEKKAPGFAIAASTCGFGYEGTQSGNEFTIDVYVRFYCEESWHNANYDFKDVLAHEQLHFDICEVYGRMFYKGVVELRAKDELSQESIEKLYHRLTFEYEKIQDVYDDETNHSINGDKQREWNVAISKKLEELSDYSDYKEF
jgi:hypothetical protein